jgi:hypothetical protein
MHIKGLGKTGRCSAGIYLRVFNTQRITAVTTEKVLNKWGFFKIFLR